MMIDTVGNAVKCGAPERLIGGRRELMPETFTPAKVRSRRPGSRPGLEPPR